MVALRTRADVERTIDMLIDLLDQRDAPDEDREDDDPAEHGGDDEPSLGAPENHQDQRQWAWGGDLFSIDLELDEADLEPTLGATCYHSIMQEHWSTSGCPLAEDEPSLGSPEAVPAPVRLNTDGDQTRRGQGGLVDIEHDLSDREPSLGATTHINQNVAWSVNEGPYGPDVEEVNEDGGCYTKHEGWFVRGVEPVGGAHV